MLDSTGTEVVKYTYDAWGKPLSTTGSLASTLGTVQPFRYRGYVYDVETGIYYLRSRYYTPIWKRFINADSMIKGNVFAYCNNIVTYVADEKGTDIILLFLLMRQIFHICRCLYKIFGEIGFISIGEQMMLKAQMSNK